MLTKLYHENNFQGKNLPAIEASVSPQALALFRKLTSLARRSGYACVKLLETLAEMFGKSVRATRYALAELEAAGWIRRQQTRKGGVSKLFFWPLVQLSGRSAGRFEGEPIAGYSAAYSPSKLQSTPSTPSKERNENSDTANDVAVSLLKEVCPEPEALELAREATLQKLSEEQVKRVIAAYNGQVKNILNRGAWLRTALRRGFAPSVSKVSSQPAPASVVASPTMAASLMNVVDPMTELRLKLGIGGAR